MFQGRCPGGEAPPGTAQTGGTVPVRMEAASGNAQIDPHNPRRYPTASAEPRLPIRFVLDAGLLETWPSGMATRIGRPRCPRS